MVPRSRKLTRGLHFSRPLCKGSPLYGRLALCHQGINAFLQARHGMLQDVTVRCAIFSIRIVQGGNELSPLSVPCLPLQPSYYLYTFSQPVKWLKRIAVKIKQSSNQSPKEFRTSVASVICNFSICGWLWLRRPRNNNPTKRFLRDKFREYFRVSFMHICIKSPRNREISKNQFKRRGLVDFPVNQGRNTRLWARL